MRLTSPIVALALLLLPRSSEAQLYRSTFLQAAPGRLLELIDVVKARQSVFDAAQEARPHVLRHSQGDRWDILLLEPLGVSLESYYAPARAARRSAAAASSPMNEEAFARRMRELVAWREDMIVRGPSPERVADALGNNGFAHLEIFLALAGRYDDLLKERAMENTFAAAIGRPENIIFTRESGAAWDAFTIGSYRDMVHYATSAVVPAEKEDAAAKAAGFANRAAIGPYLRGLINVHHDNLLTAVR